eukprot:956258-Prymnesium_polylepis.2
MRHRLCGGGLPRRGRRMGAARRAARARARRAERAALRRQHGARAHDGSPRCRDRRAPRPLRSPPRALIRSILCSPTSPHPAHSCPGCGAPPSIVANPAAATAALGSHDVCHTRHIVRNSSTKRMPTSSRKSSCKRRAPNLRMAAAATAVAVAT